jgi:ketosteroid isomerase-like protein
MGTQLAQQFMDALRRAEETKDVAPLVKLFADDAELESPVRSAARHGAKGARRFWDEYLRAFGSVRSEFTHVKDAGEFASLEWSSSGTLPDGTPVRYAGVSLIDGSDGKVSRFSTYYDSAAFLPSGSKHVEGSGARP